MKNLFLTLVLLVTGITNAQNFGSYEILEGDGYVAAITGETSGFDVSFSVSAYEDGSHTFWLYYNGVTFSEGSFTGYITFDGGRTFEQGQVRKLSGGPFMDVETLFDAAGDGQLFKEGATLWMHINGQTFKFDLNGFAESVRFLDAYKFNSNPFGAANPFKG